MRVIAELALVELTRQEKGKAKATSGSMEGLDVAAASSPGHEWLYSVLRDMVSGMERGGSTEEHHTE